MQLELELPAHTSLNETLAIANLLRTRLLEHEQVEQVHWFLGESAPTFYYNIIPRRKNISRYAEALVQLKQAEGSRAVIHELQAALDREFPGARLLLRQLEQGPPFGAPIEVRLYGPDLQRLQTLGDEVRGILVQTPDVIHTRAELSEALPKLALAVDEEQARLAGLDHTSIARQLDAALEGHGWGIGSRSHRGIAGPRSRLGCRSRGTRSCCVHRSDAGRGRTVQRLPRRSPFDRCTDQSGTGNRHHPQIQRPADE